MSESSQDSLVQGILKSKGYSGNPFEVDAAVIGLRGDCDFHSGNTTIGQLVH